MALRLDNVGIVVEDLAAAIEFFLELGHVLHFAEVSLVANPYLFSHEVDGSIPWKPGAVSRYFTRVRERVGLNHLDLHSLREFMET